MKDLKVQFEMNSVSNISFSDGVLSVTYRPQPLELKEVTPLLPSFKRGDFVTTEFDTRKCTFIYKDESDEDTDGVDAYCGIEARGILSYDDTFGMDGFISKGRLATDSERQLLLDALARDGKVWDAEKLEVMNLKWRPKTGEKYFVPSPTMTDLFSLFTYEGDSQDRAILSRNIAFRTKEEAIACAERMLAAVKE